jgi:GH15 family glucan-1,4-alpha-glucosidase
MPLNIEDYALIGDCRTAALVGVDGSIDWLCWPRFDSSSCFTHLLGEPENGRWKIAPRDPNARASRVYRGNSMILETSFETATGQVSVTDFMPVRLAHTHVVRIVEGVSGHVDMNAELIVRFDYGAVMPWARRHDDTTLAFVAGPDRVVLRSPVPFEAINRTHSADFRIEAGQTMSFVLTYNASFEDMPFAIEPEAELVQTSEAWAKWADRFEAFGSKWDGVILRSLLTLRALIYQRSGGIVAAPTPSLPEQLGGPRNWDYRFCWLRDATFTLLALMNGGFQDEAKNWRDWLIRALGGEPGLVQILYGLGGERRAPEMLLPWLSGYQGAQPVRIGNDAASQLQLDIYGEVLDALYQSRVRGLVSDDADWPLQCELLKHLELVWREPDEGIWEVRGGRRHFTYSKIMAWVAFDRAVRSVEEFGLPGPVDTWRTLARTIRDDVCAHGYDAEIGAFVQSYGSKDLDASVLLMALVGFLPAEDPRVRGTVEAIERDLLVDGLILRYRTETGADGLPPGEGAFLACSFWFVDNLVLLGRIDDARAMFERLVALCNDVGLLAEEFDVKSNRQVGNFPQAFSHISLINSGLNLARAESAGSHSAEARAARESGRATG